jgi:hypothetical protein
MKPLVRKISLALLVACVVALVQAKPVTLNGYLLDKMCSTKVMSSKNPSAAIKKHTAKCSEECQAGGYGVMVNKKYYEFDAKGNELATAILKDTKKTDSLSIQVTGTIQGNKINVDSLKETP